MRVKGRPRRFRLSIRINSQLYLALQLAASTKHVTVSTLVEQMVWASLSKMASGNITERLRHVHALINEIVAEEGVQRFHAQGQGEETTRRDIRANVEGQDRRNPLSEKTTLALEQLYDLTQSERVKNTETRAAMYSVLARLATVNARILNNAAEEYVALEVHRLREEDKELEASTRELEERPQAEEKAESENHTVG